MWVLLPNTMSTSRYNSLSVLFFGLFVSMETFPTFAVLR